MTTKVFVAMSVPDVSQSTDQEQHLQINLRSENSYPHRHLHVFLKIEWKYIHVKLVLQSGSDACITVARTKPKLQSWAISCHADKKAVFQQIYKYTYCLSKLKSRIRVTHKASGKSVHIFHKFIQRLLAHVL